MVLVFVTGSRVLKSSWKLLVLGDILKIGCINHDREVISKMSTFKSILMLLFRACFKCLKFFFSSLTRVSPNLSSVHVFLVILYLRKIFYLQKWNTGYWYNGFRIQWLLTNLCSCRFKSFLTIDFRLTQFSFQCVAIRDVWKRASS